MLSTCNVFVCHRDAVLRGCVTCCLHVMCSCVTEMLYKEDATLAFAAFGAAHYDSFPIAVLPVAQDGELEEFLLCFNGMRSKRGLVH